MEARAKVLPSFSTAARTTSSSSQNIGAHFNDHGDSLTAARTHSLSIQIKGDAFSKHVCPEAKFCRNSTCSSLRVNKSKSARSPSTTCPINLPSDNMELPWRSHCETAGIPSEHCRLSLTSRIVQVVSALIFTEQPCNTVTRTWTSMQHS